MHQARWALARQYARLYGMIKDRTGRNLPGLGRMLRLVRDGRAFESRDLTFAFDPQLATAYGRLIAGDWNEPETHTFLGRVLDGLDTPVQFVDVGANVGEVLLDVARHERVVQAIGYEPDPRTAANLCESIRLSGAGNVEVRQRAVADGRAAAFSVNRDFPVLSRLDLSGVPGDGDAAPTARLDDELAAGDAELIVLIDAEGAELLVLTGMRSILAARRPLIIFEFNELGQRTYGLEAVRELLGSDYRIWRLRIDGTLDRDYANAWNCVAIPVGGVFDVVTRPLVRDA